MPLADLLTVSIATAYLSFVTVNTDGLGGMFAWIRAHDPTTYTDDEGDKHSVTTCIFCLAFWVALSFVLVYSLQHPMNWDAVVINTFAVAGLSLMATAWSGLKHL